MIIDRVGIAVRTAFPTVIKRNMGTSYVLYAKAADPIQQLFLDKISEFKSKINDPNFIKQFPELQKNLDEELMRVTRQHGGNKPEDLAQLPPPKTESK
ncbi:hypothetical protein V9T40_005819 [Parthenolecanium corni]|uniref:ATP synthase-coupling factor 6, mitochondrial n=1 Tax=Parthenolecanium corni TaxID=536013 RepID=A0AAN9TUW7_9HEMI